MSYTCICFTLLFEHRNCIDFNINLNDGLDRIKSVSEKKSTLLQLHSLSSTLCGGNFVVLFYNQIM